MTTKEILIAARKLIEKEENWTQKSYARDRKGQQVSLFCKNAYSFCIGGAIQKSIRKRAIPPPILGGCSSKSYEYGSGSHTSTVIPIRLPGFLINLIQR